MKTLSSTGLKLAVTYLFTNFYIVELLRNYPVLLPTVIIRIARTRKTEARVKNSLPNLRQKQRDILPTLSRS